MLLLFWSAAITGITLKTVFFESFPETLGLSLYVGFGWLGIVSGALLWRRYGFDFVKPLLWGGVCYTAGGVFEFLRTPTLVPGVVGPHELFNVSVLIGMAFHWRFVHSFAERDLGMRSTDGAS
jgi:channel protein (hemolysin III family)